MSKILSPEKEDPLKWWHNLANSAQSKFFSAVFLFARMFLSMPAGSAPSERVFSQTTDVVTKKRNSIGDGTLEKLIVIRSFLKSRFFDFQTLISQLADDADKRQAEAEVEIE